MSSQFEKNRDLTSMMLLLKALAVLGFLF